MATGREIYLTQEGLDDIKKQYRQLVDVERVEVIEQLQAARAMGDLSENADYDSARNRQAEIEGKIAELENIIANAVVVESNKQSKTIGISNIIRILDLSENEEYTVKQLADIICQEMNMNQKYVYCDLPEDDPMQRKPDITKAEKLLNWKPKYSVKNGLNKTIKYFKEIHK